MSLKPRTFSAGRVHERLLTRHLTGETASWAQGLAELTETAGQTLRRDNVGYAVPVRHRRIRAALNAPALDEGPDGTVEPAGDASVFGYPRLTCLSVDVRYVGDGLPDVSETLRGLSPFDLTSFLSSSPEEIVTSEYAP
jgi:hypothetical protein